MKCCLAGLEEFVGSSIITDAVRSSAYNDFNMVLRVVDNENASNNQHFPRVKLFQSWWEEKTQEWSFNDDITNIILNWNKASIEFLHVSNYFVVSHACYVI